MNHGAAGREDRHWHEVIANPIDLKKKAPKLVSQTADARLKQANEIVARVVSEFSDKIEEDLQELDRRFAVWAVDRKAANLEPIRRIIHNLRGQGVTFGFDLITAIGASFDRYMAERDQSLPVSDGLVRQHVEAIRVVYRKDIRGKGDDMAQAVVQALNIAVAKVTKRADS